MQERSYKCYLNHDNGYNGGSNIVSSLNLALQRIMDIVKIFTGLFSLFDTRLNIPKPSKITLLYFL